MLWCIKHKHLTLLSTSTPNTIFVSIILPPTIFTFTSSLNMLIYKYSHPISILLFPIYQSLYSIFSISLDFSPTHLVSYRQIMLIFLLNIISTDSITFCVNVHIFHVANLIILSCISILPLSLSWVLTL